MTVLLAIFANRWFALSMVKQKVDVKGLLLFTADLTTIGAMCVVSLPGALAAAVLALAGAGEMSSSSEMSETLSKLKVSSSTGAGCTGAG
jgi:hypothetical protein